MKKIDELMRHNGEVGRSVLLSGGLLRYLVYSTTYPLTCEKRHGLAFTNRSTSSYDSRIGEERRKPQEWMSREKRRSIW